MDEAPSEVEAPPLSEIASVFARYANTTFGGGSATIAVLKQQTLLVLAAIPIGRDALNGPLTIAITVVALPLLLSKRVNTLWIVSGAAALSFSGSMIGVA